MRARCCGLLRKPGTAAVLAAAAVGGLVMVMLVSGMWLYAQAVFGDPVSSRLRDAMRLAFATTCVAAPPVGLYGLSLFTRAWRESGTWQARGFLLLLLVASLLLGAAAVYGLMWGLFWLNEAGAI